MLDLQVKERILHLATPAKPTEEQKEKLLSGWDFYFTHMNFLPSEQMGEFNGIMHARVQSGVISIVAPFPLILKEGLLR